MTDEQIKQQAEEYALRRTLVSTDSFHGMVENYLAGVHSRDEEVKELKEEIESLKENEKELFDGFTKRGTKLGELMKENVKLCNPWISVEEHPTDVTKDYLLEYEDGTYIVAMWDSGMWMSKNLHPLKEPIRWMPIPQIEKVE